ncbi:hypothetical protein F5X99DRAFT_419161 [Biscogniauxia marginata]|nr:hypothetical protein F5X99DRAFT_419161 [Biscogniauxia marginata]
MSQREPTRRSTSPRTSISSSVGTSTSPDSLRPGLRGGGDPQPDNRSSENAAIPRTNGESTQPFPQRGLGVRNILNPAEVQSSPVTSSSTARQTEGSAMNLQSSSSVFASNPMAPRPLSYPGYGMMSHQPRNNPPPTGHPSLAPPLMDRGSPTSHPFPAISAARRILTPRSPRSNSTSSPYRAPTPQQSQFFPPGPPGSSRGPPPDSTPGRQHPSPRVGGPQHPAPHFGRGDHAGSGPATTLAPLTTPPRSLSQPMTGPYNAPPRQEAHHSQSGHSGHVRQQHSFSTPSYPTSMAPSNRGFPLPPSDPRWAGGYGSAIQQGAAGVRGMPVSDGQNIFGILPTHGENIIVPIEMYQGSKQADEKRQRNAGASARFRQRKKDKEIQQAMNIQKLETQARELEKRVQDAESERDRYRSERDRLRDIVYRTPGISELAYQGPPSPISSRSGGGSFADRSPLVASHPPPQPSMSMQSYGAADPVTGERASRRRRTDSQLEYSSPTFGSMPSSTLPPIPPPTYAGPLSQPGTPSAGARTSRLPPLRLDQPTGTPTTAPSNTSTPAQAYPPYKRELSGYESGWATRPSGPHDPGQR